MDRDEDQDDDVRGRVIVSPSLVYSGKLDASWPMPEEFDKIFMHLFEDLDDGKPSGKPLAMMSTMTVWTNYYCWLHKPMNLGMHLKQRPARETRVAKV